MWDLPGPGLKPVSLALAGRFLTTGPPEKSDTCMFNSHNTRICATLNSFFFFWPRRVACRILVPRPGIEPVPPAVEAQSLKHWTAREAPEVFLILEILAYVGWHLIEVLIGIFLMTNDVY